MAPAASAALPPSSCTRDAPAITAVDTTSATIGMVGPNGMTNVAGRMRPANTGERKEGNKTDTTEQTHTHYLRTVTILVSRSPPARIETR